MRREPMEKRCQSSRRAIGDGSTNVRLSGEPGADMDFPVTEAPMGCRVCITGVRGAGICVGNDIGSDSCLKMLPAPLPFPAIKSHHHEMDTKTAKMFQGSFRTSAGHA